MIKKGIMAALLLMAGTSMYAQSNDFNYLTVAYADTEESISLPIIQRITFEENCCVVTTTDDNIYKFPLSELSKMTFTSEPTAIEALPEKAEGLIVDKNTLKVTGNGFMRIYNAAGTLVQIANIKDGANINIGNLPAGLYIVNMGNKTIKVRK